MAEIVIHFAFLPQQHIYKDSHLHKAALTKYHQVATCLSGSRVKFSLCVLHHDSKLATAHLVLVALFSARALSSSSDKNVCLADSSLPLLSCILRRERRFLLGGYSFSLVYGSFSIQPSGRTFGTWLGRGRRNFNARATHRLVYGPCPEKGTLVPSIWSVSGSNHLLCHSVWL